MPVCGSQAPVRAGGLHPRLAGTTPIEEDTVEDREPTQDAPVMDGADEATPEDKKAGAREQRAADAAVGADAADAELDDDLRSIRGYGEDR